jgi:hypothetical protein
MTTHYSAAELGNLVATVNRVSNSHGIRPGTAPPKVGDAEDQ